MQIKSEITGLTADSRKVKDGYLFAALPGSKMDGRDFIPKAIESGALVIIAPLGTPQPNEDIEFITHENPRHIYALACAEFYQKQPAYIVAVTGTNGKTSTVNFVQQIWQSLGVKGASLGTLGIKTADEFIEGAMTTPDPQVMHETLAGLSEKGITHVAMEASSHGIHQSRLDGVKIKAGAFTNLTQDHLDYHGDMESYFQAKALLFSDLLPDDGAAVLDSDMPYFSQIKSICEKRGLNIYGYGHKEGEYLVYQEPEPTLHGYDVFFSMAGKSYQVKVPLVGRFQVDNAFAAMLLVLSEGEYEIKAVLKAVSELKPVRGRLESVAGHPSGAGIFVDYAHTSDALENALQSLKHHVKGKLICVYGCGGDRDKTKRPLMAKAAAAYSDLPILTDDNPRTEDPASIRADALQGAPDTMEIGDRAKAIWYAIENAEEGDIVLIAGKGHEQGQEINGVKHPFDDVTEAKKVIEEML